jgi:hypothetical protein
MAEETFGPDFFCIGAQRAGTGWLYEQLRNHPDFWMPPLKELHYFDRVATGARDPRPPMGGKYDGRVSAAGRRGRDERDAQFVNALRELSAKPGVDLEAYCRLFESKGSLISGDITPGYSTLADELIGQIMARLPDLKVIFVARDPVERAWSQLTLAVHHGLIPPFDVTDLEAVTRSLQSPTVQERSYPSRIVTRWRRHVSADSFRIFFYDDLKSNPRDLRHAIITFLGGDAEKPSGKFAAEHNSKANRQRLKLTDKARAHVARFFEAELKTCATEFGGPAAGWPKRYGF